MPEGTLMQAEGAILIAFGQAGLSPAGLGWKQ
jgi:hypothetical protein